MSATRSAIRGAAAILLLISFSLVQLGCTDSDYRKATRAAAGIATGLGALQDANESLFTAQLLQKGEARAIAQGVQDAARVNGEFIKKLRTLKTIDASNKQLIGVWFSEVLTSIETLNDQGVLRVKNADAKAELAVIFAGVQSSVAILTQLMAANGIVLPQARAGFVFDLNGGDFNHYFSSRGFTVAPAPGANVVELPAGFDAEVCKLMITPSDPDAKRCPLRATRYPTTKQYPQQRAARQQEPGGGSLGSLGGAN